MSVYIGADMNISYGRGSFEQTANQNCLLIYFQNYPNTYLKK